MRWLLLLRGSADRPTPEGVLRTEAELGLLSDPSVPEQT